VKHAVPNLKTSCHIRSGRAFDQVEKLAEELRADLIKEYKPVGPIFA